MARSCVLRRSTAALTTWRKKSSQGTNFSSLFAPEKGNAHRMSGALARFLGSHAAASSAFNSSPRRHLCTGKSLGTAVLDECNNAGAAAYSSSTGIFHSLRPPLKIPEDPCMDVTTFVLSEKENIGSKPALIDARTGEAMTYAELLHAVSSVELGLVSIGVRPGDVVLLVSRNSVHYPVIFLATTSVGGVLATLNPLCTPSEAKKQAEAAGARFIIVEEEFADKVSGLGISLVIIEKGQKIKVDSTEIPFSELLASDPTCSCAPETKINRDDPALVLYSSGASKAVVLSHKNVIAQILQLAMLEGGTTAETGTHLCSLPMSHVFGLVVIALQQLYRGATLVVTPKLEMVDAPALVSTHKVSHLYAVPGIITNLAKIMTTNSSSTSLSSLQRVTCGGAPLAKELIEEFCKHVPDTSFVQIYGLTEASGAVALNNLKEDRCPGSVGTLLSGIEAKVLSGDKESLGPNAQGELHVRGPNVMKGYANNPEATAGALDQDGWLSTGDLVSFDEEGRVFIIDRIKESVKHKAYQGSG